MSLNASQTNSTPCSSVIINLVILSSVIGRIPFDRSERKKGITDPREPNTFPYLTTPKDVSCEPEYELPATNSLSDANFVAPYKLIGELALSVERAITFLTFLSIAASIRFIAPIILVFTHSKGLYSAVGTIFVDSIYTPIKNVKYSIENFRVEQKTDYEKLVMEIDTDGSINPKDALKESARILIHHFQLFSDERITLDDDERAESEEFDETSLHMRQLLKTRLVDMDLSVRALNCLKAADVETLGELVSYNKNDLLKFRNFGKKSLTELEDLIESKGLSFGMDVSKYKLDRE